MSCKTKATMRPLTLLIKYPHMRVKCHTLCAVSSHMCPCHHLFTCFPVAGHNYILHRANFPLEIWSQFSFCAYYRLEIQVVGNNRHRELSWLFVENSLPSKIRSNLDQKNLAFLTWRSQSAKKSTFFRFLWSTQDRAGEAFAEIGENRFGSNSWRAHLSTAAYRCLFK